MDGAVTVENFLEKYDFHGRICGKTPYNSKKKKFHGTGKEHFNKDIDLWKTVNKTVKTFYNSNRF